MNTVKIVVTDYVEDNLDWEKEQLAKLPVEFQAFQLKNAPFDEVLAKVNSASILVVNMLPVDEKLLSSLKECRLIIRHGAGYDNVDIDAATQNGILVCYIPDYCQEEVSEQTIMLLLNCLRKFKSQLVSFESSVKKGQWDFSAVTGIRRFSNRKAGIVGCGRIGSNILKILRGFGIDCIICDPYLTMTRQEELGIQCRSLSEVLSEADFVTLHCSYTKETHHLINEKALRMMKPDSFLINTSRGNVVDLTALGQACQNGWIAGAAIDVFGKEPPGEDLDLIGLDNVILTPHLSYYSLEAEWSIRKKIIEDIIRYVNKIKPRYPLNQV